MALYEVMLENDQPILDEKGEPSGRNHYRRMICDVASPDEARALAFVRECRDENGDPTGFDIVAVKRIKTTK